MVNQVVNYDGSITAAPQQLVYPTTVEQIQAIFDVSAWQAFLRKFNDFASQRNGIPLLNQSPFVTQAQVQAAYGQRWTQFSAAVLAADPAGRMLNPFFAALLSS